MEQLSIWILSFCIGFFSALLVSRFGIRFGFEDIPTERSSHKKIIPRGGGIGIPLAVLISIIFFVKSFFILLVLSMILSVFALIDDRINLPVWLRFGIQLFVSLIFILVYRKETLSMISNQKGLWAGIVFSLFFILVITTAANFFNFMDGINGIAGLQAIVSFGLLLSYISQQNRNDAFHIICITVIASTAGFLMLNFPKARVFMGDVGSIFIGFFYISLVVMFFRNTKELLVLLSFQFVFYIDCLTTIFIRLIKGQNILKPHLMHLYQRLVHKAGWSHLRVTLHYAVAQTIIGVVAIILAKKSMLYLSIFLIVMFFLYMILRWKGNLIE